MELINLAYTVPEIFGVKVIYWEYIADRARKCKKTFEAAGDSEEVKAFVYRMNSDLIATQVNNWHSRMSYLVRYTFCDNRKFVDRMRPILRNVHEQNAIVRAKPAPHIAAGAAHEILEFIKLAKPNKDTAAKAQWVRITTLLKAYIDSCGHAAAENIVSSIQTS